MGQEIERKFLVDKDKWSAVDKGRGKRIEQGYLSKTIETTVRVRVKGDKGYLTIKGKEIDLVRAEFEYEIPLHEAEEILLKFCNNPIRKIRYEIRVANHSWEVDEFISPDPTLILAEIELDEANESFAIPDWVLEEVTGQAAYYNANM
jgi:CYTH domain-containing protein